MKKIIYILSIIFLFAGHLSAQYFPVFSQYISNGLVINPAYTGSREVLSINLANRNQMVGYQGAPMYQTLSVHAPMKNPKLGFGVLVMNENVGPSRNTQAFITYAYKIKLAGGKLNFGLQTGAIYNSFQWGNIYLNETGDPAFSSPNSSYVMPNIGAGVYYYSRSFFAGVAVPHFLSYKENASRDAYTIYHNMENYNFLISSGYLFDFSRHFKLKATTLVKYSGTSEQIDINLNSILWDQMLTFGFGYRMREAMVTMAEVQINPQFRVSYAFEYAGKNTGYFNYTSHEIGLRYEFSYKLKAFNPRYF